MCERRQREFLQSFVPRHRRVGGEKDRNAGNTVVEIGSQGTSWGTSDLQPVKTDPGGARAAANGVRASSSATLLASAIKFPLLGATTASGRKGCQLATPRRRGDLEIELVFCRMTSICQASSCSSKLGPEPGRDPCPRSPRSRTEMPVASRISFPLLGDTKCGTFSSMRAERSARCNGHADWNLLPVRHPGEEVRLRDQRTPSSIVR